MPRREILKMLAAARDSGFFRIKIYRGVAGEGITVNYHFWQLIFFPIWTLHLKASWALQINLMLVTKF